MPVKRGMIAQRNQRDHLLFCFSICRFDCIACDNFFVINNGHFLNWQNVYLVGNQLQFTSLNGTHILPRLCNPKLLFALFSNLKCLSSRQVNKCRRKKNPLNYDLHIPIAVLQRPVHVLQSWHYM